MVREPGEDLDERWRGRLEEVPSGLRAWRAAHPRATVRAIEAALDERVDRARAQMLEEAARTSPAADLAGQPAAERARCPRCGGALQARDQQERTVTVRGDQPVRLRRSYAVCTACGAGVFPPG